MQQGSFNSEPSDISCNVRKSALIRENDRTRLLETLHHESDTKILFRKNTPQLSSFEYACHREH